MKTVIELVITLAMLLGSGYAANKIFYEVRRAALTKIAIGLPPLQPFTRKLIRD